MAHEGCIFSSQPVGASFNVKNTDIATYKVFDKQREIKGVLTNGHLFEIKSWSCDHYGWRGRLVVNRTEGTMPAQLDRAFAQLGKLFLDRTDNQSLMEELKRHPMTVGQLPAVRHISDSGYDQFLLKATAAGDVIIIEISFYQS